MKKSVFALIIAVAVSLGLGSVHAQEQKPAADKVEKKDTKDAKQGKNAEAAKEEAFSPHRDIEDLPVPYSLKLDKDNTFLVEAKGIKVGVLTYTGRVDGYSLSETIKNTFTEEKWKFQNMLTYKKTVSINFTKAERTCSVFIEEGFFSTRLEIRVGITAN